MAKRGPKTAAGKAVVSLNAVSHGALSNAVIVPGIESLAEWESFRDGLLRDLAPEGAMERLLADQIAGVSWRLGRVVRHEAQMITAHLEHVGRDYAKYAAYRGQPVSVSEAEQLLETTCAAAKLLRAFHELPDDGRIPAEVCIEILEASGCGESALLAAIGPEDGVSAGRWTAARLRAALEMLAGPAGGLAGFINDIRDSLDDGILRRQSAVVETRDEMQRLRRQRMLPEDRTLHNIVRYEAHLSRLFYRAYHELEALQSRRTGLPSTITRLQMHGLPGG